MSPETEIPSPDSIQQAVSTVKAPPAPMIQAPNVVDSTIPEGVAMFKSQLRQNPKAYSHSFTLGNMRFLIRQIEEDAIAREEANDIITAGDLGISVEQLQTLSIPDIQTRHKARRSQEDSYDRVIAEGLVEWQGGDFPDTPENRADLLVETKRAIYTRIMRHSIAGVGETDLS